MPQFKCLACNTRLHSTESDADPIGDLCPVCGSLLEPLGDLGEIVGYRVVESHGSTSHSGASRTGQMIAGRVGEIIARRELKHARVRLEAEDTTLTLLAHKCKPSALALPARAAKPPDAAAALAPQPRRRECRASSKLQRGASSARTAPPDESSHFAPRPRFG
jgi:hypothetical protein